MKKLFFIIFVLITVLCGCEKQDFSIICDSEYPIDDTENFSYIIANNSDEKMQVTLAVGISKYKDGKWVPLSFSDIPSDLGFQLSCHSETSGKSHFLLGTRNLYFAAITVNTRPITAPKREGNSGPRNIEIKR